SDMEGVSGLIDKRLVYSGEPLWRDYGRYLLTEDINAIASALYSGGIKRIYLSESHNFGKNTMLEYLLPFVTVLPPHSAQSNMQGKGFWEELYRERNIIGAIMVGCHAMEGANGFLPHSWDSKVFEYIKVNGETIGEIGLSAGLLGYYDIPLIAVIGDEAATREAGEIIPEITRITVKYAGKDNWFSALLPEVAHELISKKIYESLRNASKVKPLKFKEPVKLHFKVRKADYLTKIRKDKRVRLEKQIVHIDAPNYPEAYDIFWDRYLKMIFS
ncbi:MAG: M55 family metallopeptidase, partial [Candidatus Edwardsbacteria bacterium]|nr:M55 family metallopeptidase [Candidatus Edwardsbacteria bacterium]